MTLRWLQRWLHQHIFKVGWLLTKNSQTTTILYYIFFLPGVVLNQLVYWLVAGLLDVRADRAIKMPEKQEVGELKLNFVKLSPKAGRVKIALINTAPFAIGIIVIWFIANNIFNVSRILTLMSSGTMDDIGKGLSQLLSTPDVWLWLYLAFAVSNTMMSPNPQGLRGWWIVAGAVAAIGGILFILGVGGAIFTNGLAVPINTAINLLSGTFAVIIILNLFMTGVLSVIENTYEWLTGDSATFKDGKMVAIRRTELQALRQQEQARAQLKAGRRPSALPASSGMPSIYKMPLPIPGAPGKEAVTQLPAAIIQPDKPATPAFERQSPGVITATASSAAPAVSPPALRGTPIVKPDSETPATFSPAASKPSGSSQSSGTFPALRPSVPLSKPDIGAESDEKPPTDKPAVVAPARPAAFQALRGTPITKPASDETDEDQPSAKPAVSAPRSSPFQPLKGTPIVKPDSGEQSDDKPAVTSPARPFQSLRTTSPASEDDKPAAPASKPAAFSSRPNAFQSLRGTPITKSDSEDEEDSVEDQPATPQRHSPFQSLHGTPTSLSRAPSDPRASLLGGDAEEDYDLDDDEDLT